MCRQIERRDKQQAQWLREGRGVGLGSAATTERPANEAVIRACGEVELSSSSTSNTASAAGKQQ
uniref:Uncharacterized protein n=1 Tax=Oryza meridionalis TaxID=40149 RepID=A0A0E0FC48_9ORYZ